ncbi:putative membrane protein [Clostridioides difficile CD160]|nr:putative membrane protein [Clostridioides difficile CD160]
MKLKKFQEEKPIIFSIVLSLLVSLLTNITIVLIAIKLSN